jgi:hypothetical protein
MARSIRIVLCEGFRGHDVVVAVDGREVYRRSELTTEVATLCANAIDVLSRGRLAHVEVFATPGDVLASLDVDVNAYAVVAIDLVGTATVSFETAAWNHAVLSGGRPATEGHATRGDVDDPVNGQLR